MKEKKEAAALPLALTCGQIRRKCGKCHQIRHLERRPLKSTRELEEEARKKNLVAAEVARREAAAAEVIGFMCRHAVGDKVTRPPCDRLIGLC